MMEYMKCVVDPFIKQQNKGPHAVLIFDCWSVHRSEEFRKFLKQHYPTYYFFFIPAGCTSVAQPADVILQRPFKHGVTNRYSAWLTEDMVLQLNKQINVPIIETSIKVLKPLIVQFINESWMELKEKREMIVNGWNKCGLIRIFNSDFQNESTDLISKFKVPEYKYDTVVEDEITSYSDSVNPFDEEDMDAESDEDDDNVKYVLTKCVEELGTRKSARIKSKQIDKNDEAIAQILENDNFLL
jgi:hypothetical protein